MNQINYLFGDSFPASIHNKLTAKSLDTFLFGETPEGIDSGFVEKGVFYPDGTPMVCNPDVIYPRYAGWYLGTPIPSAFLDVTDGYSRHAATAAIMWLRALLCNVVSPMPLHHNGETISISVNNVDLTFCVPDTAVVVENEDGIRETIPVIPVPDVMDNKDDWAEGCIPIHVEQQALLTLWLHQVSHEKNHRSYSPTKAYVVRITGNTAGDVEIRTVKADPKKCSVLISRLCRAVSKARADGKSPMENLKRIEMKTWLENKQASRADACVLSDEDFRETLREYMATRSDRATKEGEADEITEEMEAIAIELASMLSLQAASGVITDGTKRYSVSHAPKVRKKAGATISASLLNQFYPELNDAVNTSITKNGKVNIDVL